MYISHESRVIPPADTSSRPDKSLKEEASAPSVIHPPSHQQTRFQRPDDVLRAASGEPGCPPAWVCTLLRLLAEMLWRVDKYNIQISVHRGWQERGVVIGIR